MVLGGTIVVGGDDAGADIGGSANVRIAEIGQVAGLGAGAETGRLDLYKVADPRAFADVRARTQSGERTDNRAGCDCRAHYVAEGPDSGALAHADSRTEKDMRLDHHVGSQTSIP